MKQQNRAFIDISICKFKKLFVHFLVHFLCTSSVTYFEPFLPWKMLLSRQNKVIRADPDYIKDVQINWKSFVIVKDKNFISK